jgi:hypothetical protein
MKLDAVPVEKVKHQTGQKCNKSLKSERLRDDFFKCSDSDFFPQNDYFALIKFVFSSNVGLHYAKICVKKMGLKEKFSTLFIERFLP